jgi:hypothetical protein
MKIPMMTFEAQPYEERAELCKVLALLGYPVRVVEKIENPGYSYKKINYYVYVYPKEALE